MNFMKKHDQGIAKPQASYEHAGFSKLTNSNFFSSKERAVDLTESIGDVKTVSDIGDQRCQRTIMSENTVQIQYVKQKTLTYETDGRKTRLLMHSLHACMRQGPTETTNEHNTAICSNVIRTRPKQLRKSEKEQRQFTKRLRLSAHSRNEMYQLFKRRINVGLH
jgi:hypothetical protein